MLFDLFLFLYKYLKICFSNFFLLLLSPNNKYILKYEDLNLDENAKKELLLDDVDFIFSAEEDMMFLIGLRGDTWYSYYVVFDGYLDFENFFYKTIKNGKFIRISRSAAEIK